MPAEIDVFLGRQPILDRHQRIVAYELLYRSSSEATAATFSDEDNASARVIVNTFTSLGADQVLGETLGFFNFASDLLMGNFIHALPPERVVIEILESVVPTRELIVRCEGLRKAGFRLALDDYVVDDPRERMLHLVDFVKVDFPNVSDGELGPLVHRLRRGSARLLAEKVETQDEFHRCMDLGFDLFQGYFFARPEVLRGKSLGPRELALIDLIGQLDEDMEVDEIVDVFKRDATLGINLMRLVNSAAMIRPHPLGSIVDAVNHIGRSNLRRWAAILLFAGNEGVANPLFPTAARRGRLMELICEGPLKDSSADEGNCAFLVGMLSLVDVLLDRPLEEILGDLNLHPSVSDALLRRVGILSALRDLVEAIDRMDVARVRQGAAELGIDAEELQALDLSAYAWVHSLTRQGP